MPALPAVSEGRHRLERYITGLLSEHPNKNCDTLAQVIPGSSEQSFQGLLTTMVWDAEAVNNLRVQRLRRLPTEGDGVLVLDDTGFPKKGTASAGVARQYTGTTGTVTTCQVAVTCVYAERTIAWPVAARLYLPQSWADDAERRARAHVPEDVRFQTKPEIALALVDQARDMGVPYTCITVDSGYGDVPSFLDGLEVRDEDYVAAIHRDFGVATHADGHDTQRVDRWVAVQPSHRWRTLSWRDGINGPLMPRPDRGGNGIGVKRSQTLLGVCHSATPATRVAARSKRRSAACPIGRYPETTSGIFDVVRGWYALHRSEHP